MPEYTPYPGETASQFAARQRVRTMQAPLPVYMQKPATVPSVPAQQAVPITAQPAQPVITQPLPQPPKGSTVQLAQQYQQYQASLAQKQMNLRMGTQPAQAAQPTGTAQNQSQGPQVNRPEPPKGRTPHEQQGEQMTPTDQAIAVGKPLVKPVLEDTVSSIAGTGGSSTASLGTTGAEVGMSTTADGGAVILDAAGNPVATSAIEGTSTAAEGTSALGVAGQALGAAAAIYAGYNMYQNWGERNPTMGAVSGAAIGAYAGTYVFPVVGTAIGAVAGAVIGGLIGNIKAGKHDDQVNRDRFRSGLRELGITDQDHLVKFTDGTVFDMGKDGGNRLNNVDGSTRRFYEIDPKNKFAHQAVGWVNPLAITLAGGNVKLANDFAAYFANAALTNSASLEDVRAKVIKLYQDAKISGEQMGAVLADMEKKGLVTQDEAAALLAGYHSAWTENSGVEMSVEDFLAQAPPSGVGGQQQGAFTPDAYEDPNKPAPEKPTEPLPPLPPAEMPPEDKPARGEGPATIGDQPTAPKKKPRAH